MLAALFTRPFILELVHFGVSRERLSDTGRASRRQISQRWSYIQEFFRLIWRYSAVYIAPVFLNKLSYGIGACCLGCVDFLFLFFFGTTNANLKDTLLKLSIWMVSC